jgi:hypothetical protein
VAKDGRPQILEAPSQKAEEQRIEKREDEPDRALLSVGEPKEHRRQYNSGEYANRVGAGCASPRSADREVPATQGEQAGRDQSGRDGQHYQQRRDSNLAARQRRHMREGREVTHPARQIH